MTSKRNAKHSEAQRRFREALERKSQGGRHGEAHKDTQFRIRGAHAPVTHKRTFRRKTG